jgi:O-antigen/teichoic acid export membrane protein
MNQSQRIFKNTVALTISELVDRASNVILSFFIARMLHATGLGIYSAAVTYHGLLALAGVMGATNYLVREIAKDRAKTNRYVVHLSVMGTAVSAIAMVVFSAILPYLGYSAELATAMYVIILAIIPGTLNEILRAVFIAHQRVELITYTRLVTPIVEVGVSLYLLTQGYGVVGLLVAFVITRYVVMMCYFYFIHRFITALRWEFEWSFARTLIREIKTFATLSILSGLFAQPEIIILSLVNDETQVGFYSAALKAVNVWSVVPDIYMTNVFPVLSRSYHLADQKSQLIQDKSIKYLLAISLPLTAGMIAAAGPIINLLYGPGFEPSVGTLQVLAWIIMLNALNAVVWRVLIARDQQGLVLQVRIITLLTRLGGGYLLSSALASLGAAISTLANLLLNTLLLALYARREGTRLHILRLSWRFALAALAMGVVTWALSQQMELWALVPSAAAVYTLLVFSLKAFSPDDLALFRKIWQPGPE